MDKQLIDHIESLLGKIVNIKPLTGGDISAAHCIQTGQQRFFIKSNTSADALSMFKAEQSALDDIRKTGTVRTPEVYEVGSFEETAFLIMAYIEPKTPSNRDLEKFGSELAELHKLPHTFYGGEKDNFIGPLKQINHTAKEWPEFYGHFRLWPQIKLAVKNARLIENDAPDIETIMETCRKHLHSFQPSLIHGDLWSGNYLIAVDGNPYLIDPASYLGHHLVDIAMSKLFGGFGPSFYKSYYSVMGSREINGPELDLYQLYYLLVHLNLFGHSYATPVKQILRRYF